MTMDTQLSNDQSRIDTLRSVDEVERLLDNLRRSSQNPEIDDENRLVGLASTDRVAESSRLLAALVDLITRLENSHDVSDGAQRLSDLLGEVFSDFTVYVGLIKGRREECRLSGVSNQLTIDRHSDESGLIEATFLEVIHRCEPGVWPPDEGAEHALLAHKQLANHIDANCISSFALVEDQGKAVGALVFVAKEPTEVEALDRFVAAAAKLIARSLHLLSRIRQGRVSKLYENTVRFFSRRRGQWIVAACVIAFGLLFVPIPYQIAADVELQPVARRFVTTPFKSRLKSTSTEPGDVVSSGQVIARLDGREIEIELAAIDAELHQAEKEHAGYLARHESGRAEIARLEIERVRQRQSLLPHRMNHLEIRSPIHGVVISGDLSRSVGVPLQVGEALYEIAPLNGMVVEIAVPERDIRLVEQGSHMKFRLDAFPSRRWSGVVKRIHPRAELKDNKNVFIAEVELVNDGSLGPGMQGTAHIEGGNHQLGWVLFHRAIYSIQVSLGW